MEKEKKIKLPEIADKWCKSVTRQITYIPDRGAVYREMAAHIEDIATDYRYYDKMSAVEAYAKAVERMGNAEEIGKELNKQHKIRVGIMFIVSKIVSIAALAMLALSLVFGLLNWGFLWNDYSSDDYDLFKYKDLEKLYEYAQNNDGSKKISSTDYEVLYYRSYYDNDLKSEYIVPVTASDEPIYNIEKLDIIEPDLKFNMCDFSMKVDKVKVGTMPEIVPEILKNASGTDKWKDYICQMDISAFTFKPWNKFDFFNYLEIYDDKGCKVDFEYVTMRHSAWNYDIQMEINFDDYLDKRPQYVDFTFDKGDYDVSFRIPMTDSQEDRK
ncbi:MAG: permease prefix domain 1-containing protein [Firmicutes bacterium]|nr:permease prefix domain 1-containing protein [Bacillota bacterium]